MNTAFLQRRSLLLAATAAATLALTGCATQGPSLAEAPPIVFVHGNGDTAALWQTTAWRFESNGWPRRLPRARGIGVADKQCSLACLR